MPHKESLYNLSANDFLNSGKLASTWNDTNKAFTIMSSAHLNFVAEEDGERRTLFPEEEEKMMGFPKNYTFVPPYSTDELRHCAIGNSFQV